MKLTVTDVDPNDLDVEALDRGMTLMSDVVARADDVHVIVAGDFEQAVRDRVDDPEYAAAYTAQRLFGRAAAKTIAHDDGTTDLIIDAWQLSKSNPPAGHDAQRMFHHEALHIATDQRGELMNDLRLRHGLSATSNRGYFAAVTGVMIEEYRTERALCDSGRWPHDDFLAGFGDAVEHFANAALDGISLRYEDEPIDRCVQTVLPAFHQLATYTGYVAAEYLACQRSRAPRIDPATKNRLLGQPWDDVVESLDAVPSAATPTDPAVLDELAWTTSGHVERWLQHVGFTLTDLDDGSTYFEVLRHDFQWPFT